jgi:uncharacterized protein (DUF342 family)
MMEPDYSRGAIAGQSALNQLDQRGPRLENTKRVPEIPSALQHLSAVLSAQEKLLEELEQRLSSVRNVPPETAGRAVGEKGAGSQLASAIHESAFRVEASNRKISSLLASIEL